MIGLNNNFPRSSSPDVHCGCRHVSEFTSYNLHNLPYDGVQGTAAVCFTGHPLSLRRQGYQAWYVFLELSLPLFSVLNMLAHSINTLVPVGLEVSLKPADARALLEYLTQVKPHAKIELVNYARICSVHYRQHGTRNGFSIGILFRSRSGPYNLLWMKISEAEALKTDLTALTAVANIPRKGRSFRMIS